MEGSSAAEAYFAFTLLAAIASKEIIFNASSHEDGSGMVVGSAKEQDYQVSNEVVADILPEVLQDRKI